MFGALNTEPDYQGRYRFHPFLWEAEVKEEDLQGMDWQQYVNLFGQNLSQTHLVIGMLWSRLGLELTNFINPITGRPYRSGTEYELFTSFDAQRNQGLPSLLFYQCNRPVPLPPESDDLTQEKRRQLQLACDFVQEMQGEQMIPTPVSTFSDVDDLCGQVRADLARALPEIEQRLKTGVSEVSTLPALPLDFVTRQEDIIPLVEAIHQHHTTVLFGIPGQGKTVMARAVCDEMQTQFPDGMLWATIGQRSDLARVQREWILQLHGNVSRAHDAASAHEELLRCLAGKTALLVLDDVWQSTDVQLLTTDLPASCHMIITTRHAHLLADIPTIELGPMSRTESRELLRRASKGRVADPVLLDEIAHRLGHLALALKIVGARLASFSSWEHIREQLQSNRFTDLTAGQRNVYLSMDASVQFLPADQQQRYRELVIFPPAEPLVEQAVARLWQATANVSAEASHYLFSLFQSLALIQSNGMFHELQRDYLIATTSDDKRDGWQNTFLASYGSSDTWGTLPDDGYAWRWFSWHLVQARRLDELRHLLLNATYLQNKIARMHSASLQSDWALLPDDRDLASLAKVIGLGLGILDNTPQELPNQVMGRAGEELYQLLHDWPSWSAPHFRLESSQTLNQAGRNLVRIVYLPGDIRINRCVFNSPSSPPQNPPVDRLYRRVRFVVIADLGRFAAIVAAIGPQSLLFWEVLAAPDKYFSKQKAS